MNESKFPLEERLNPRMLKSENMRRCELNECNGACCVFGVWVDPREVNDILSNSRLIIPSMPENSINPGEWFAPVEDIDVHSPSGKVIHTAVETIPEHYGGTACIFWRSDAKCALQVAAVVNNLHPWRFKPYYCILHPLDLDEEGRFTLDETDELLNEPGSCLRQSDQPSRIIDIFEPELRYLIGEKGYSVLLKNDIDNSRKDASV
jgi:hypothetical protein